MSENNSIKSVVVRKATRDDIEAISSLHREVVLKENAKYYPEDVVEEWLGEISPGNVEHQFRTSSFVAAEDGDVLVGFGQYSIGDGEIYQIGVAADRLGQGIGSCLYDYIEDEFRCCGRDKIHLNSTLNAVKFYQKKGFVALEKVDFELSHQVLRMVRMEKILFEHSR